MKILLLANMRSTHTRKWALALKEQGVEVALFSLDAPNAKENWYREFEIVYFPPKKYSLPSKYFNGLRELQAMLKKFEPDILHSHFITNYSFLGNISGFKPHVVTAWGSDVYAFPRKNAFNRWLVRYNLRKAGIIISTSKAMAAELSKYSRKKIEIIPFGVDFSLFSQAKPVHAPEADTFQVFSFKHVEPVYGTDTLLKAFKIAVEQLKGKSMHLTIAGEGSWLPAMHKLAKELGIETQVSFPGKLKAEEVPDLIKKADLCFYLSRRESFGVSLIEAMAAKVPLVVTRTEGFIEVSGKEQHAFFVDVDNEQQAAAMIVNCVKSPEAARKMAELAYNHAKSIYDLNQNIASQIDLYNRIIQGNRRSQ